MTEHEDWCPFGDHEGECYEALMECMKKADPERWAELIDGYPESVELGPDDQVFICGEQIDEGEGDG